VIVRLEGKGKKGRPRKNGPEKFEEGMKVKGMGNIHAVARNWKKWRSIVLEAKVQNRMWNSRGRIRKREIKNYLSERNFSRTHYS